jgi:class 3 adenylate cyclase
MTRPPRDIVAGFVLFCAVALGLMSTNALRGTDWAVYDMEVRWLHAHAPSELAQDVVVIGLDEAAYESIAEPYALWHRHLGELFAGLAEAHPAVVGVAAPLPVRSYDFLVKGIDAPLLDGIRRLRSVAPLVVGQPMGVGRRLRPIAPELLAAAGPDSIASLVLCEDSDGTVRRLNQRRCVDEDRNPPFSHMMAKALGREGSASGLIDYSAGGEIEYIPLKTVLDWIHQGGQAQLQTLVQGRAVVVASLLPTETRYRVPVPLAAWERGSRSEPAAVVHVQALRSMLGRGLVEPASTAMSWLLAVLTALLWFGRNGWVKMLALVATIGLVLVGSTFALWHGLYLHAGNLLGFGVLAFLARLGWESMRHFREKQLLRTAFAGHVSPQVMRAILGGQLKPDGEGERSQVAILFADIRGFTARSEKSTPEAMIALLNRYYAEVSAAIHGRGGAIDKFIGDGLMATFGVPQPLPAPERNALEAAQDMLVRLVRLNDELKAEGLEPLEIGIGIHAGEVLAGYVGSRRRRDFTVIGDPVNTASRLEGLSKTLGYPVICSHEIAAAVGFAGGLVDLGAQPVKGRSDVHVWGWNPPLIGHLKKGRR